MTIPRAGVERYGVVLLHTQDQSERAALLSEALLYDSQRGVWHTDTLDNSI